MVDSKNIITLRNEEGVKHCSTGPAVYSDTGEEHWYVNGRIHRIDGPAIVYPKLNIERWCLSSIEYTFEKWIEITPVSKQKKLMLKLKYG